MSITDELRKYAQDWRETPNLMDDLDAGDIDGLLGDLEHIADRIDAEHERLMQEQPFTIDMVPITDESMAKHGWIRLPKDADGEYIQPSDIPILIKVNDGRRLAFCPSLELRQDGTWRLAGWSLDRYRISKPTVEDVLREFGKAWVEWEDGAAMMNPVETFAAKLRLAEGEGE